MPSQAEFEHARLPDCHCRSRPTQGNPTKCSNEECPFSFHPISHVAWTAQQEYIQTLLIKPPRKLAGCSQCQGQINNPKCERCHGYNLSPALADTMLALEPYVDHPVNCGTVAEVTGRPSSWASHKLNKLHHAGRIKKVGHGMYIMPLEELAS